MASNMWLSFQVDNSNRLIFLTKMQCMIVLFPVMSGTKTDCTSSYRIPHKWFLCFRPLCTSVLGVSGSAGTSCISCDIGSSLSNTLHTGRVRLATALGEELEDDHH